VGTMGLWDVDEGIIAASFTNQGVMVDTKLHGSRYKLGGLQTFSSPG
jgi:hypothetical protein